MVSTVHCRHFMTVGTGIGGRGVMEGPCRERCGAVTTSTRGGHRGANCGTVGTCAARIIAGPWTDVTERTIVVMETDHRQAARTMAIDTISRPAKGVGRAGAMGCRRLFIPVASITGGRIDLGRDYVLHCLCAVLISKSGSVMTGGTCRMFGDDIGPSQGQMTIGAGVWLIQLDLSLIGRLN